MWPASQSKLLYPKPYLMNISLSRSCRVPIHPLNFQTELIVVALSITLLNEISLFHWYLTKPSNWIDSWGSHFEHHLAQFVSFLNKIRFLKIEFVLLLKFWFLVGVRSCQITNFDIDNPMISCCISEIIPCWRLLSIYVFQ